MQFSKKNLVEIVEKASTATERLEDRFISYEDQQSDYIVNSLIQRWCQVIAQGNWEKFENRLTWDKLDFNTVRRMLGSVRLNDEWQLPTWAETLNEVMQTATSEPREILQNGVLGRKERFLKSQNPVPFEEVLSPFICVARQKLIAQASSSYCLLSEDAHASLERNLLGRLAQLCSPTMELEFSLFRVCNQSTVAHLLSQSSGISSHEQYRNFLKRMIGGEILPFFQKYSVLARLAATLTDLWVDSTKEFLLRLESDWLEIQRTFADATELEKVIAIQPSLSDPHHNGRSVMVVTFASGLKLVYKPKDIGLEQAYFRLLAWMNQHDVPLPFKLLKVINRSSYGWVEFVEPLACKDQQEARRYYQRSGMLACVVYVMQGTDFHHENLIAAGEQPVLIDMETLMHPRIREVQGGHKAAQYLAYQQFTNSVLGTGLLPRWQFGVAGRSYDATGLGGVNEQETPVPVLQWNNINTDSMRLSYEYVKTQPHINVPSLDDINLSPNDYTDEIVQGFQQMYQFFVKHREAIQAPDGPLTEFAYQKVRFVFRSTRIYRDILEKTTHPKFLRDGAARSIQLDALSSMALSSDSKPIFWPLLKLEHQALEQLDIPLFRVCADSENLILFDKENIEKYFTKPSFNLVISCLNQLNNQDLEQQIGLIQGSLYSLTAAKSLRPSPSETENAGFNLDTVIPITELAMVQQATVIATDLQKRAICSNEGSAAWIAPQYIFEAQRFHLQPTGHSLYDGGFGVGLFLAALEKVTSGAGFSDLALATLHTLRQDLYRPVSNTIVQEIGIGGAAGCGAIIYALVRISEFLESPPLLEDAKRAATLIEPDHIAADQNFDIISGSAGAILGLLTLYNSSADPEVLNQAITCGHHLLNNRVVSNSGIRAWATLKGKLMTGFSHGAAGIAYALLRLYQVTHEAVFLEAAQEAIAYERSVFIPEEGNWPDFRGSSTKERPICMCSWCHGAPGIGLARVAGLDILDTPEIRQDIEAAINTTKQHKLSVIDHLCCGNLGRTEFLFTAGQKLSQPQLVETAMEQAAQVVARAKQKGSFAYGSILNFHPGFFQGAAGIGYELLRLAYPDILPSVLLWE
jgi:type 2 lantibiotic biosynthesis protein LanM